jgi:hypothetical protein
VEEPSNKGVLGLWEVCAKRKGKGKGKGKERVGAFRESEEESVEKRGKVEEFWCGLATKGVKFCFARRSVYQC